MNNRNGLIYIKSVNYTNTFKNSTKIPSKIEKKENKNTIFYSFIPPLTKKMKKNLNENKQVSMKYMEKMKK